jgi:DNA helicase-2/ATP-dependent DNA helicase PcrA
VANAIIETRHNQQAQPQEFAILYRTNAQSRAMEEALRKKDIPYRIYGGTSFYQRKEIKDLLAYCRLTINPKDDEALKRIINYPARGIGKTTLDKISIQANQHNQSYWSIISSGGLDQLDIHAGSKSKVQQFVQMIESFRALDQRANAYQMMEEIAKTSGLSKELFTDKTTEGIARYDNIQELLNGVKEFVENDEVNEEAIVLPDTVDGQADREKSLAVFLQDIALLTDADQDNDKDENKVSLMTIHASKGLEFPYVFIVGLEENLFPSQMALNSRADLEEERRLFYVALTRAEKEVRLSYAASRYKWGNLIYCEPSRFIEEIDENYLEYTAPPEEEPFQQERSLYFESNTRKRQNYYSNQNQPGKPPMSKKDKKTSDKVIPPHKKMVNVNDAKRAVDPSFASASAKIEEGMRVEHLRFGKGEVKKLEGQDPNKKATIQFDQLGEKQLLLKFAKLRILKTK